MATLPTVVVELCYYKGGERGQGGTGREGSDGGSVEWKNGVAGERKAVAHKTHTAHSISTRCTSTWAGWGRRVVWGLCCLLHRRLVVVPGSGEGGQFVTHKQIHRHRGRKHTETKTER